MLQHSGPETLWLSLGAFSYWMMGETLGHNCSLISSWSTSYLAASPVRLRGLLPVAGR